MQYYLTEAGQSYWERMDALRKKTAPAPKAKTKLHITPKNLKKLYQGEDDISVPQTKKSETRDTNEEKKTLLQRVSAWVQPSGPRVEVPKDFTTSQRNRAYKRFKTTANDSSITGRDTPLARRLAVAKTTGKL